MERQVSTIHINKFVDLPDGSTVQIVASGPLLTFLVIQKQQNGSRVLYGPPTQGVDLQGVVVAIVVNVAKQRPTTHLLLTVVSHRELHLREKEEECKLGKCFPKMFFLLFK